MPTTSPGPNDLYVDSVLSFLSIQYHNEPDAYVSDKVFPIVNVMRQSAKYGEYLKSQFFRDVAEMRAPGQESRGTGYDVAYKSYYCENYATHIDVTPEDRRNAEAPFDPDADAVALVMDRLKLKRDVLFAGKFFQPDVWGHNLDSVGGDFVAWNDYADSTPIIDVEDWKNVAYQDTATDLKRLLITRLGFSALKNHPDLIERIKYTQRGVLTLDLITALLDLEQVLVAKAIRTQSPMGTAEAEVAYEYLYGPHALLFNTPARPSLRMPSAGYTFHWPVFGGISYIRRVEDAKAQYERIEGHVFLDQKMVSADLGLFAENLIVALPEGT